MTKKDRVLNYMKNHNGITSLDAINELGNTRLAASIYTLKQEGHNIIARNITVFDRFGEKCCVTEYSLPKTAEQMELFNG